MPGNQSPDKVTTATLMTVNEMIKAAFGNEDRNAVNFKLMQTIFVVLANQLRLLGRQVAVEIDPSVLVSSSNISITEFKIVSTAQKKNQINGIEDQPSQFKHQQRQTPDTNKKNAIKKKAGQELRTELTEKRSQDDKNSQNPQHDKPSNITTKKKIFTDQDQSQGTGRKKDNISDDVSAFDSSLPSSLKESSDTSKDTIKRDKTQEILTSETEHDKTETHGTTLRKIPPVNSETKSQVEYTDLLEKIEEQRERILRIIHQRKNSLEESASSPTPMASIRSSEVQMEKLLVVGNLSEEELHTRDHKRPVCGPVSIVTKYEFDKLVGIVVELQKRFSRTNDDALGETSLLQELRKGSASLSEAVGALQLSARLEQVEGNIEKLMNQITQLAAANTPKAQLKQLADNKSRFEELQSTTNYPQVAEKQSNKSKKFDDWSEMITVLQLPASMTSFTSESSSEEDSPRSHTKTESVYDSPYVSKRELKSALKREQTDIIKLLFKRISRCNSLATEALKKSQMIENKLTVALNVSRQYLEVERMVTHYAEQVTKIDAMLTAQLGNFQEQMTKMQFDLDVGLDNFAEAIAKQGIDPESVLDLNAKMASLRDEIESSNALYKDSKNIQKIFALDLNALKKEIELLRDTKSDRDEVWDAMRDKAGIKDLNNNVTMEQFMVTVKDIEKKIFKSYDVFNAQELRWQKVIEDLYDKFHDKADLLYLKGLRDDITRYLNRFKHDLEAIQKIVGEPFASGVTRRIYRDAACISCSNPAHPAPPEAIVPRLPSVRQRPLGAEISKQKGHDDRTVCIPGLPIPHQDSTTEMCTRYCGGSQLKQQSISHRNTHGASTVGMKDKVCQHKNFQSYGNPCLQCREPKEGSTATSNSSDNVGTARTCFYDEKDKECPCSADEDIQSSAATGILLSMFDSFSF